MKRDMSLVREILQEVESWDAGVEKIIHLSDRDDAIVQGHVELLSDAGLLNVETIRSLEAVFHNIKGITWTGYDLLDSFGATDS